MKKAEEFLNELKENEQIREQVAGYSLKECETEEDALTVLAGKLGFDITKEELKEAMKQRREKIEEARRNAETASAELRSQDLAAVNGGVKYCDDHYKGNERCRDTFQKGEWCWSTDWCEYVTVKY